MYKPPLLIIHRDQRLIAYLLYSKSENAIGGLGTVEVDAHVGDANVGIAGEGGDVDGGLGVGDGDGDTSEVFWICLHDTGFESYQLLLAEIDAFGLTVCTGCCPVGLTAVAQVFGRVGEIHNYIRFLGFETCAEPLRWETIITEAAEIDGAVLESVEGKGFLSIIE